MDKQYYKEYYKLEREHWWFMARGEILASLIKRNVNPSKRLKILNIGTATGGGTAMLEKFGDVTSIEYDEDCCQFLNEVLHIPALQGSITELEFEDNSFDLVCAFDVIEHVEDDGKAASEMLRVCKKDGLVFATVPAFMLLWSEHDVINHHHRRYKINQFRNLFKVEDANILFKSYFNFFFFIPIATVRILMWPFQKGKVKAKENAESDFARFNTGFLNKLFYKIFLIEKSLLKIVRFPVGVSITLMIKK
jgi:SAM-dependent methyltransferase